MFPRDFVYFKYFLTCLGVDVFHDDFLSCFHLEAHAGVPRVSG